jgi:hypothetical protein
LDVKMMAAASAPGALNMGKWHCGTAHCRAGWAVVLAGEDGANLERRTSTYLAARLIYMASTGREECPDFFASNEDAMKDIRRCALE